MRTRSTAFLMAAFLMAVVLAGVGGVVPVAAAETSSEAGTSAAQRTKVTGQSSPEARFGNAVATSGDTVLVGASEDRLDSVPTGSATVFVRAGSEWVAQAELRSADANGGDFFGGSVALDGDTALVGAATDNVGGIGQTGSAYVFVRSGSTWTQQARLTARDRTSFDNFGWSVALQGDTAVVTALQGGADSRGSAYVFSRTGTSWNQRAVLRPTGQPEGGNFGCSISIDGGTVVVGHYPSLGSPVQGEPGAAFVFVGAGAAWSQQAKLTAPDGEVNDDFGGVVSLSRNTVVVTADFDSTPNVRHSGSAYVFTRSGVSWALQAKLAAAVPERDERFGTSASLDGNTVVIGSYNDAAGAATGGAAYVFTRTAGTWAQRQRLLPDQPAGSVHFGISVALEGRTLVVGAHWDGGGSAYIYVT